MVVTTFKDSNVETNWVCENFLIIVKEGTFLISLIYLPFKKIYVVLGTDWLSANSVYINYEEKIIFIPTDTTM